MDAVSYAHSAKQAQRIESFIENPDSTSGIITVPKTIASGETIIIPAGRVAVLPNTIVEGNVVVEAGGEIFVPAGATYGNRVMYEKINYIATQGQTVFSVNYDLGSVDVYVNGIRLANTDFTATTLTSVTLASGLNAGDIVELVSFGAFTVADTYTKAETDNKLGLKANTADLKEIGVGQTWQDLTASRAIGTTYTNSTGKPIYVKIVCTAPQNVSISPTVDGVVLASSSGSFTANARTSSDFIVPNGATYSITGIGGSLTSITTWSELR